MLLGVWLALVRGGISRDPEKGLGDRLNAEQIQREAAAYLPEACAPGAAGVIDIHRHRAKTVDTLPLHQIGIGDLQLLRPRRKESESQEEAGFLHDTFTITWLSRGYIHSSPGTLPHEGAYDKLLDAF